MRKIVIRELNVGLFMIFGINTIVQALMLVCFGAPTQYSGAFYVILLISSIVSLVFGFLAVGK
jgi:hypothetical protein